mmetsp:Transcript_4146/g.5104  ORF Transcript_4146/g.5104 Transcript_4146/m.5104 type:complete len:207 (-) Transcript_4146:404-1024(-)
MILDKRIIFLLIDEAWVSRGDRNILSTKLLVCNKLIEDLLEVLLHLDAILLSHGTRQRKLLQVPSSAHTHREILFHSKLRNIELLILRYTFKLGDVPVGHMLCLRKIHLMILLKSRLEERLQGLVVIRTTSVAPHARVRVLNTTVHAFEKLGLILVRERVVILPVEALEGDVIRPLGFELFDALHDILWSWLGLFLCNEALLDTIV